MPLWSWFWVSGQCLLLYCLALREHQKLCLIATMLSVAGLRLLFQIVLRTKLWFVRTCLLNFLRYDFLLGEVVGQFSSFITPLHKTCSMLSASRIRQSCLASYMWRTRNDQNEHSVAVNGMIHSLSMSNDCIVSKRTSYLMFAIHNISVHTHFKRNNIFLPWCEQGLRPVHPWEAYPVQCEVIKEFWWTYRWHRLRNCCVWFVRDESFANYKFARLCFGKQGIWICSMDRTFG